jgi:hypothetical protein
MILEIQWVSVHLISIKQSQASLELLRKTPQRLTALSHPPVLVLVEVSSCFSLKFPFASLITNAFSCISSSATPTATTVDPHFRASNGQVFSYHGECDLVLMSSNDHASAFLGIDVHVRTTRIDNPSMSFSYISSAAVKIGEEVMEVSENDDVFFNKGDKFTNFDAKSTTSFAGYTLTQSFKGRKRNIVVYSLDLLEDGRSIEIRVNKNVGMVYVDINGYYDDSTGLVGASEQAGLLLSRDGAVDLAGQWNTLGEEWQVRNTEPKLFRENRAPQYPAGCIYEQFARKNNVRGASKQANRRRLMDINVVSREDAIKACSKSTVQFMEYCVDDVMVSGDVEVAEDSFYQ